MATLTIKTATLTGDRTITWPDKSGTVAMTSDISTGALVLIAEVVTSGSQASVTFSSIVSTYRHLKIVISARSTNATTTTTGRVILNGDTGANYSWKYYNNAGAATNGADSAWTIGELNANTSPANTAGAAELVIYDYKSTTFQKSFVGSSYTRLGTLGIDNYPEVTGGTWLNTAAVTSITVSFLGGNFTDGSVVSLYGMS